MKISNSELEMTILGSAIKTRENFLTVFSCLKSEDFSDLSNKMIFNYLRECYLRDHLPKIDELIDCRELKENKVEPKRIFELDYFGKNFSIKEEIEELKELTTYRRFISADELFKKSLSKSKEKPSVLISNYINTCREIIIGNTVHSFSSLKDLTEVFSQEMNENLEAKKNGTYENNKISSCYSGLNRLVSNFGEGHLIIVGARPGVGKSAFLVNLVNGMMGDKKNPAIFSLEMTNQEIISRLISLKTDVDSRKIKYLNFEEEEICRIVEILKQLKQKELLLNDGSNQNIEDICLLAKQAVEGYGSKILFIDYLQLMHSKRRHDSRYLEVGYISSTLKILAKELKVPIIALCQLNRASEDRASRRPIVADLRESGSLEQDADVVILLHQELESSKHGLDDLDIIVGKNRHGAVGNIKAKFYKPTGRITEVVDEKYV